MPAGGFVSTVSDLHLWDMALHAGNLLPSEQYKQLIDSTNFGPHAAFDGDTLGYGYGVRIHGNHSIPHIGHGGRGFGFVSIKFYIPEADVDVVIWENVYFRGGDWMKGDLVYYFENEIRKIVLDSSLTNR